MVESGDKHSGYDIIREQDEKSGIVTVEGDQPIPGSNRSELRKALEELAGHSVLTQIDRSAALAGRSEIENQLAALASPEAKQQTPQQCAGPSWTAEAVRRAMGELPVKETGTRPNVRITFSDGRRFYD